MIDWLRKIGIHKKKPADNLRIGLALGGGGVRGLAHVGVLSVLQREAIPIHAIAGCSMGAIVGVAYGLNPKFSTQFMAGQMAELGVSLPGGFYDTHDDSESFWEKIRQFIDAEKIMINTMFGWGTLPETKVVDALQRLTMGKKLEESHIALAVVAADLIKGDKIVFKEGPAHIAIQASSALPGFLPPVKYQDRLLVDGAFVDMIPTEVVRDMGVNFVIAVDVNQENIRVEVNNGMEALQRAVELCASHHKRHHLKLADLVIHPDFGEPINPLDFKKTRLCIETGIRAAENALPELRKRLDIKAL